MAPADFAYIIDTFFALFAMTLIIFMVPGFAMLEAGLVRTKNVTTVLTVNTMIYAVASMAFLLIGYTWAFGSWENDSMSKWAAFLFQMAFVGKAINIMSGGVSERVPCYLYRDYGRFHLPDGCQHLLGSGLPRRNTA